MNAKRTHLICLLALLALSVLVHVVTLHLPLDASDAWRQTDEASVVWHFTYVLPNPLKPQFFYDGTHNLFVQLELQVIPWLTSLLMRIFGWHTALLHVIPDAFFTLNVYLIYRIGVKLFTPVYGLFGALLYLLIPYDIYYGQALMPEVFMMTMLLCTVLAVNAYLERETWGRAAIAGLSLLLMALAKLPAVTIAPGLAAFVVVKNGWRSLISPKVIASVVFAAVFTELYLHYEGSIAVSKFVAGDTSAYLIRHLSSNLHPHVYIAAAEFIIRRLLLYPIALLAIVGLFFPRTNPKLYALLLGWGIGAFWFEAWVATHNALQYYYLVFVLPGVLMAAYGGAALVHRYRRIALVALVPITVLALLFTVKDTPVLYTPYQKNIYALGLHLRSMPANDRILWIGTNPIIFDYSRHYGWRDFHAHESLAQKQAWIQGKIEQGATVLIVEHQTAPDMRPLMNYLNSTYTHHTVDGYTVFQLTSSPAVSV